MLFELLYSIVIVFGLIKIVCVITKGQCKSNACLIGKTVLVTGGNSGIGYETSLNLASRGARVIIADVVDATNSVKKIKEITCNENIKSSHLDLANFASVRQFASKFLSEENRLDILINNAGCGGFTNKTDDGIYKIMQINYFGPFLLTNLLTPLLKQTKNARVVFVSSILAFTNNLSSGKNINCVTDLPIINTIIDYGNSKACMLAATKMFAQQLEKYGIMVTSCHPGVVNTPIYQTTFSNMSKHDWISNLLKVLTLLLIKLLSKTPFEGAQIILHCALANHIQSGDYIVDCMSYPKPPIINNGEFCTDVWAESIRLTGLAKIEATID